MTPLNTAAGAALLLALGTAAANPAADPAAMGQLIDAVSLDLMSETAVDACADMGVAAAPQLREAWAAWRERHQLAPLRMVMTELKRRQGSSLPSWDTVTGPMRERVLRDPAPDKVCAALVADWQGAAMDVTTLFPQARAVAKGLVQARMVAAPKLPPIAPGAVRGQVLLPSQMPALAAQHGRGWSAISDEAAQRALGQVYVKGRVARRGMDGDRFHLVQEQGDREAPLSVGLEVNAEPWMGREVVVRGLVTSLGAAYTKLSGEALVSDPSGLTPSPLPQAPLQRKEVLLQRVTRAPGGGLADKDLAAIVLHGEASHQGGTQWQEDVRFLLRDGTAYGRTGMPPDQLDAAASRRLEPQQWARWRSTGRGYELQPQDEDGRPGRWQAVPHEAVKPWPANTQLDGSFSRGRFRGSLAMGGTSSTHSIRFTRDGRFERSFSALSSTGTLAEVRNNTVIAGSAHGDGKGSSRVGGSSVGTGDGSVGAFTSSKRDDGASRRGRYQLSGYVLTLTYDDGHQERLLSFPVAGERQTVYVGDGSYSLDK